MFLSTLLGLKDKLPEVNFLLETALSSLPDLWSSSRTNWRRPTVWKTLHKITDPGTAAAQDGGSMQWLIRLSRFRIFLYHLLQSSADRLTAAAAVAMYRGIGESSMYSFWMSGSFLHLQPRWAEGENMSELTGELKITAEETRPHQSGEEIVRPSNVRSLSSAYSCGWRLRRTAVCTVDQSSWAWRAQRQPFTLTFTRVTPHQESNLLAVMWHCVCMTIFTFFKYILCFWH